MIHILLMIIFPSGSLHLTDKSDLHSEEIPVIAIPDPAPHHQRRGPHRHQEGSHQNCQQDPLGLSACECIYKQEDENTEWHLLPVQIIVLLFVNLLNNYLPGNCLIHDILTTIYGQGQNQ